MRYLLTFACCFWLLAPQQVHACFLGAVDIFPKGEPSLQHEADVIAKVYTLDRRGSNGGATVTQTARVIHVYKSPDSRIKEGDTVAMRYQNSSCIVGPSGRETVIFAKPGTDGKGNVVLHLYAPIGNAPAMLPEGFSMRPRALRVGESIPENTAVILVAVAGEGDANYLDLSHAVEPRMMVTFTGRSNSLIAIPIPIGIKQLSIYSNTRQSEKINRAGSATVQTPKLDIDRPGLYYLPIVGSPQPNPELLTQFRNDYSSTIGRLEPVNFKWPSQ